MNRRQIAWFLAILILVAVCAGRTFSNSNEIYRQMNLVTTVYAMIRKLYVNPEETKVDKLFQGACRGMVESLGDPHSVFLNMEQNKRFTEDTQGEFGGIGIEIGIKDGILTIMSPIRDTPGYDAGLLPGDRIIKIDGKSTEGISLYEAVKVLRGKVGSKVVLTVRHPNARNDVDVTIERALIKPPSLASSMLDEDAKIAYVQLFTFTTRLGDEFTETLEKLKEQGMRALVLDLRGNPGGDLSMAVRVSDAFIAEGPIVSVKGRDARNNRVHSATRDGTFADLPLVCLVNRGSASASEIVAGCLRDHERALLIGERTYGKGSVQNIFPVGEGTALKLTTAQYFTPKDLPIKDDVGINPDIEVPMSTDTLMGLRLQEREDKLRGHYKPGLSGLNGNEPLPTERKEVPEPETPKENWDEPDELPRRERVTDIQLKAAVKILRLQLNLVSAGATGQ